MVVIASPPEEQPPALTEEELANNRTFMTIVHYILTYPRWSFSLFLLLASRSLPLPDPRYAVRQPMQDLLVVVNDESDRYYECTVHAFRAIAVRLNDTVDQEQARIQLLQEENTQLLVKASRVSQECTSASETALRGLETWQQKSTVPFVNGTDQCSNEDRANLTQLLGSSTGQAQDEIGNTFDTYSTTSETSFNRVADYAQKRAAYDYNYFIGVKLQTSLDLLNNLTIPDIDLNLQQAEILEQLKTLLQAIIDALQDAYNRVDILSVRLASFHTSINGFYTNYLDVFARLKWAADYVRDFLPDNIPMPPQLRIQGIPLGDALLPSVFELPNFQSNLPDVNGLVASFLSDALQLLVDLLEQLAKEASEQVRETIEHIADALRELLTLKDYHPPHYVGSNPNIEDFAAEEAFLTTAAGEAKSKLLATLERIKGVVPIQGTLDTQLPNVDVGNPGVSGNTTLFGYLEPQLPSFDIPDFIAALFSMIIGYQWLIEIIVQFVRFRALKKKYERNATPDMPEIDYREEEDELEQRASTLSLLQIALIKHFLTPWMALGLILLPFTLAMVTLWLPHVKTNCMDSRNGTFVARNLMTPLLINKASMRGNSHHMQEELQCRRTQRQFCDQYFAESDYMQRNFQYNLQVIVQNFNQSISHNGLIERCVDIEELDYSFNHSCCGLEAYTSGCTGPGDNKTCPIDNSTHPPTAFHRLSDTLNNEACGKDITFWELSDSRFNCSTLDNICSAASCGGVDENFILNMVIEADCQAETYVIQCCLLILLALYHAILINLCTALMFNGVKHLRWRSLRPDGIKLKTNVNERGDLVKGASKVERSTRIASALRRFERIGRLQLYAGQLFFLVWFISFFIIRDRLRNFAEI